MKKIILSIVCFLSASYIVSASAGAIYMDSTVGNPWGQSNNEASMTGVFGAGNWTESNYETANTASLFSASTSFIFMEGGDDNANELQTFLSSNITTIEGWVFNGGRLIINSAPNEGNGMSYGFGGISLNYPDFGGGPLNGVDSGHAIFNGPFGATGASFTGTYFSHGTVSGPDLNDLILNNNSDSVLSDMFWGDGYAMFGAMTTLNFQQPNSAALRQNIIHYAANVETETSDIPEPTTLALLGLGLAGFGFSRKRK